MQTLLSFLDSVVTELSQISGCSSGEILRLVETYRLAWMKIDFNFELGLDASGGELSGYYRLNDVSAAKRFVLRELDPGATYELTPHIPAGGKPRTARGADLMAEGVKVALPLRRQAAVFVLKPLSLPENPLRRNSAERGQA